jgi:hypothetical protein
MDTVKDKEMNSEVKNKWTTALRSGEYTQDSGKLRSRGGYCCLGVLCELAALEGVIPAAHVEEEDEMYWYDGERQFLPYSVVDWAGLADADPRVRVDDVINNTLSELNDDGRTFDEIAGFIEEGL